MESTPKPLRPFFVIGINHKNVAKAPSVVVQCCAGLGVPNASERGGGGGQNQKWAGWLHNPCRLGGPQRFIAGDRIHSGP